MQFRIKHITRCRYESLASQCFNEARLTPRSMTGQQVRNTNIVVEPFPGFSQSRSDYFGNTVTAFAVFEKHASLTVTATNFVEVTPREFRPASPGWEDVRAHLAAQPDAASLEAWEFVFSSPYVSAERELAEYARPSFPAGRPLLNALEDLSHRIHSEFKYQPKSTSIDMPLLDVLRHRRGVCQDFAHVMIGALRSMRLAARYVSGYVRTDGAYEGAQASHAWVSVFVPQAGWIDFDPTNDVMPSQDHVTLAWGRDYGDVTPVKGVTLGGGDQTVEVEVYVQPVPT